MTSTYSALAPTVFPDELKASTVALLTLQPDNIDPHALHDHRGLETLQHTRRT